MALAAALFGGLPAHEVHHSLADGSSFDVTASSCSRGRAHTPPAADCTCGVHAVEDPRDLELILQSAEFTPPADLIGDLEEVVPIVTEGWLHDPIPVPNRSPHRLVALYEGGSTAEWPSARPNPGQSPPRIIGWAIGGDPPGTLRGSRFEATALVVRAEHRGWVPAECAVTVLQSPVSLQALVSRRYAADSGGTGH